MVAKSNLNALIYKILAHIINCYSERKGIFTADKSTEMNYLAKIRTEVFELLFAKEDVFVKWGKSTSTQTKDIKLINNGNVANGIGLKVDARFIIKSPSLNSVDLANPKASKDNNEGLNIMMDKLKFAIKSKVIVDHLVEYLPSSQ